MSSQLIKQIVSLIQENHFEEARGVINRMAAVQAADPAILHEMGKLSFLMGDLEPAEKYLRACLAINQSDPETYYQLGLVLIEKRQFAEAMPAFREACERKANFALGYFYWGLALYEMGNTQGALGQFNLAHKLDTTLFLPLYYSGLVQQKLGQYKKAQQFFEQVIGLDSSFAPVHNAIGVSHYHLGNESEAIISFQRACKISPDFATAHLNLGDIFLKLEKYETAQMHYRDTLKSSDLSAQERASAYNNLAIIDAKSKAWEKACDNLSQGHAIAPDLTNIQINLGLVLIALREYDLAISHFEQVLKRNSNEPEANFYLGLSLLCLSKRDQALEQLLKAARIIEATNLKGTALHQQLLLWLAYAHLANKNYPEAKQGLDKLNFLKSKN